MHISSEGKLGILLTLVGLAGMGALVIASQQVVIIIGWSLIIIAAVGITLLAAYHFGIWRQKMATAMD